MIYSFAVTSEKNPENRFTIQESHFLFILCEPIPTRTS